MPEPRFSGSGGGVVGMLEQHRGPSRRRNSFNRTTHLWNRPATASGIHRRAISSNNAVVACCQGLVAIVIPPGVRPELRISTVAEGATVGLLKACVLFLRSALSECGSAARPHSSCDACFSICFSINRFLMGDPSPRTNTEKP